MPDVLLFTLWGPLASMGEVAVGERRTGWDRPGKSAVMGLLAAALGIERHREAEHAALAEGYGYAVRVEARGALIEDYHTAQVPPARRGRTWATRRAELAEPELETILSLRDYRADARHTVALWAAKEKEPPHALEHLKDRLRRPEFALYLGRRSCPLGLPPAPRVVERAASLEDAFDCFDRETPRAERAIRDEVERAGRRGQVAPGQTTIYADIEVDDDKGSLPLGDGLRVEQAVRRRDLPLSRRRWQFGLREELLIGPVPKPEAIPP